MASSTDHPSSMFGTAGRAFHLLEQKGVNCLELMQRIIDDPKFRKELRDLMDAESYLLPAEFHPEGVRALCSIASVEFVGRQYPTFIHDGNIRQVLEAMDSRSAYILALGFGLVDGSMWSHKRIAEHLGLSTSRASQLSQRAISGLYRAYCDVENTNPRDSDAIYTQDVLSLGLSERASWCFRRAEINTVGDLLERTENELLSITNFGMKSLDEVVEKLDSFGLHLKPERS